MNITKKKREGEVHYSSDGEKVIIVEYKDCQNTTVQFEDGYMIKDIHYHLVKTSKFLRKKLVQDVGIFEKGEYKAHENKKMTRVYSLWKSMIRRCHTNGDEKLHTYKDVTVCGEWLYFQNFAKWYYENYNPKTMQGWDLDKDILCSDYKIYSPETCCFIPQELNKMFSSNTVKKSGLPRGITYNKGWYKATISCNKERFHLGISKSLEEICTIYDEHRRRCIQATAERLKDVLPKIVYEKLRNY